MELLNHTAGREAGERGGDKGILTDERRSLRMAVSWGLFKSCGSYVPTYFGGQLHKLCNIVGPFGRKAEQGFQSGINACQTMTNQYLVRLT